MHIRDERRPEDDTTGKNRRGIKANSASTVSVTISIGVAQRAGDIKTPEQVVKAADEALYRAKHA